MALSSLTAVKIQAGISLADTSRDAQLASILLGVTAHIKNVINRDLESASYTEYYSGDNTPILLLRQFPVSSITSIYVDDSGYWGSGTGSPFAAATLLTAGTDYSLRSNSSTDGGLSGLVYRIGSIWRSPMRRDAGYVSNQSGVGVGNIKATYVAGYSTIPADIKMAVNSLVMRIANAAAAAGVVQQAAYEDASVTYLAPSEAAQMMGSIESMLAQYNDVAV